MTNLHGYSTLTFLDIFPDYETFMNKYSDSLFSDKMPVKNTFKIIYNEYSDKHVAMAEQNFIGHFENILYTHYEKFEYDLALKKEARAASDEKWSENGDIIQNSSSAPNTIGSTDDDNMMSLDAQTKMKNKAGFNVILASKTTANKAYTVDAFLKNFKGLFINIVDKQYTDVWVSDSEGNLIW